MNINLKPCLYENHIEVNQNTQKYRMCCSIFAPMVNVYSNTNYGQELSKEDFMRQLDKIVDTAVERGSLDLVNGGWYDRNNDLVSSILQRTELEFTKYETIFDKLIENGYLIQVQIRVNRNFYADIKDDNKFNLFDDYRKYLNNPTIAHTFNIQKYAGKYYIKDNYNINQKYNKMTEITDLKLFKNIISNNCSCFI